MYYANQESIDDDIDIIESQLLQQEQHQRHQEPRHQNKGQQQQEEKIADERSNITDAHQQRCSDGDIVPLPKRESSHDSVKSKSSSDRESYISNSDRKYRRRQQRGHRRRSNKRRTNSSCSHASSSRSSHQSVPLKEDENKKQQNYESDGSNDSRDPQRRYYCSFDDYSSPGSSRDFRSSRSYSRSSHYSNDRSYYSRSSYYSSSTYSGSNNRRYYSSDDSVTDERSRRNSNGSVQSRGINDAVCTTDSNDKHKFDGPSSSLSSVNNLKSSEKEEGARSRRSSQENESDVNNGDALDNVNEDHQRAIFETNNNSNVDGEVNCSGKRSSFDHHQHDRSSATRKNSSKYHRHRTSSAGSSCVRRRSSRRRRSRPLQSNNGNGSFNDGEENKLNEPPTIISETQATTKRGSRGYLPASSGKSRDERRSTTNKSKRRSRTMVRNGSVSENDKNNNSDIKKRSSSHRLGETTEITTRRSKKLNKNSCSDDDNNINYDDTDAKEPHTKSTSEKRRISMKHVSDTRRSSRNHISDTRRISRNHVKNETRRSTRNHRRISKEHRARSNSRRRSSNRNKGRRSTHNSGGGGGGFLDDDDDSHDDVKEPETTVLHSPPTVDLTTHVPLTHATHQNDLINISDCPTAAEAVAAAKAKQEFLQRMRASVYKDEEEDYSPVANFSSVGTSSRTKQEEDDDEAERRLADALKKKDQELMDFMNAQNDAFNKKRHQEHYLKTLQEHQMFEEEEEEEEDEHPPPLTDLVLKGSTIRRSSNSASPGASNKKKHAASKGVLTSGASGTGSSGGEYDCNKTTSSTGTDAVSAITLPFELVHMATQSTVQPTSPSSFLPNYLLKKYHGNPSATAATPTGTSTNPLPLETSTSPTPKSVNMLDQHQDSSKLSPSPHLSSLQQGYVHEGHGTIANTAGEMISSPVAMSSQLDITDNTEHVEEGGIKAASSPVLETTKAQQSSAAAPAPASSPTTRSRQFLFGTSKTNSSNEITSTKSLWNNLRKKPSATAVTGGRRSSTTEMGVSENPAEQQQHNKKVSKLKLGGLFANRVGSGRSQNNNKQMSKTHHGGAGGSRRRLLFGRRHSQECKDDDNGEHPTPTAADIEKFNVSRTFHGGAGGAGAAGIMHLFNKNRRHSATGQDNPHENNNEYDEAQEEGAEEEDANNHSTMFIPFPSQHGTTTSPTNQGSPHVREGATGHTHSVTGTSTSMFGGGRSITSITSGANSGAGAAAAAAAAAAADAATKAATAAAAAVTLRASSITSATTKAFEDVASSATATASMAANAAAESSSNTKATIGKMLGRGRKAAAMHAQMPNFSEKELKLLREEKEKQLQQYKCSLRGSTTTTGTVHNIVGSENFQLSTMMEDSWRSGGGDDVAGGRGGFDVSFRDLNLGSSGNTTRRSSNPKDAINNPSVSVVPSSSHVMNDISGSFSTDHIDILPVTNLCSQVSELSARSHTNFMSSVKMDADEQQQQQGYSSTYKHQSHDGTSNDDDSMDSIDVGGTNKHGEQNDVDEDDEEIYDDAGWRRRSHDLRISSNRTSEEEDDDDMISRIMDEGSVLVSFADVRPHSHHWESDADEQNDQQQQQHHETNVTHEKKLQPAQVMQV